MYNQVTRLQVSIYHSQKRGTSIKARCLSDKMFDIATPGWFKEDWKCRALVEGLWVLPFLSFSLQT